MLKSSFLGCSTKCMYVSVSNNNPVIIDLFFCFDSDFPSDKDDEPIIVLSSPEASPVKSR